MPEGQCTLCLKKTKELVKRKYLRAGITAVLCKECDDDVKYLAKIKDRPEGWIYTNLFEGKKNLKSPKPIYEQNHSNNSDGEHELDNERPEE